MTKIWKREQKKKSSLFRLLDQTIKRRAYFLLKRFFFVCCTEVSLSLTFISHFLAKPFVQKECFPGSVRTAKGGSVVTNPVRGHLIFCQEIGIIRHRI